MNYDQALQEAIAQADTLPPALVESLDGEYIVGDAIITREGDVFTEVRYV